MMWKPLYGKHTQQQRDSSLKGEKCPAFPYGVLRRFAEICCEETTACSEHTQVLYVSNACTLTCTVQEECTAF